MTSTPSSERTAPVPPDAFLRLRPALFSLPEVPDDPDGCIEIVVDGRPRYLSRFSFEMFATRAGASLNSAKLGEAAARRLVAVSRLLVKPGFLSQAAQWLGVNEAETLRCVLAAAATAPLAKTWGFDSASFALAVRQTFRRQLESKAA